ncbi:MAG: cytochrome C biogenesis protein [Gammaproteobacteria bacterium]|nr:cytochrome C biogenesis protein [Gammaproteobacteria bacterium]
MSPDALRAAVEHAGLAAVGISLLAGFLFSFNPVALAAIPVSLAYVTKARETRQALIFGAMFISGILVTHLVLGFIAGLGGQWVKALLGRAWGLVLGPLLIVLGLLWPGWLRLPLRAPSLRASRVLGAWGAFALSIPFSVAVCPVCTPALVVLLGVAAGSASPGLGVALLGAFAIGRSIPIALGALSIGWLERFQFAAHFRHRFDIAGGVTLILAGLYIRRRRCIVR